MSEQAAVKQSAVRLELEQLQAHLVSRLAAVQRDLQRESMALSADSAERAIEIENDEALECVGEVTAADLVQVRHALQRYDAGLYGHCEHCGEAIGAARLHVQPAATQCALCAGRTQAGRAQSRRHA